MTKEQEVKLDNCELKIREVHAALVGNETLGHRGIVSRINALEEYKENDKKLKNKIAGGVAVGSVIGGSIWTWISKHIFGL